MWSTSKEQCKPQLGQTYNMERPYVGRTLSTKLAWPHGPQQNLSKTIGKRDDFTVWPDKAL